MIICIFSIIKEFMLYSIFHRSFGVLIKRRIKEKIKDKGTFLQSIFTTRAPTSKVSPVVIKKVSGLTHGSPHSYHPWGPKWLKHKKERNNDNKKREQHGIKLSARELNSFYRVLNFTFLFILFFILLLNVLLSASVMWPRSSRQRNPFILPIYIRS